DLELFQILTRNTGSLDWLRNDFGREENAPHQRAAGDERLSIHAAAGARLQCVARGARSSDGRTGLYASEEVHAGDLDGDGLQLPGRVGDLRPGQAGEPGPGRHAVLPEHARALSLLLRTLRRR